MTMMEGLESRTLFSVDTSGVALFDASGHPATINRHAAVWFLVHGDNMSESGMTDLATAVKNQLDSSQWQVLIVDWSKLAAAGNTSTSAAAVGDRVAAMIKASRVPTSRVNLIAFSSGGIVIDEIAKDLKTRTAQVNRIVGIDPFSKTANYAAESSYSIAFCGRDAEGKTAASLSADDAVALTGLTGTAMQQHGDVFSVVTTIWKRDAGEISKGNDHVSPLFSIQKILSGSIAPWRHGVYFEGFEAEMDCGFQSGLPHDLGPLSLTYSNTRRHLQVLT
jgi:hypothetical protein